MSGESDEDIGTDGQKKGQRDLAEYVAITENDIARLENETSDLRGSTVAYGGHKPWRSITPSHTAGSQNLETGGDEDAASINRMKFDTENTLFKEISDMSRKVYDSFDKHERLLKVSYVNTRFFMIENFSDTENLKYELLVEELRNKSILKDMEDIDIQLEIHDTSAPLDSQRDKKIATVRSHWLLKVAQASQDHMDKSHLARSTFGRTQNFYDELNEMEFEHLTKKHARELSKQVILHKLRVSDRAQDPHLTARYNSTEISHQKHLQWIQFKHLKETYVRMMKKEAAAMDNHLTMLDTLFQALHKVYMDVMNLKVSGVTDWQLYRVGLDEQLKSSQSQLRDQFYNAFQDYRRAEREVEARQMKQTVRSLPPLTAVQQETRPIIASDTVFCLAMTRQKALYVLQNVSSECGKDIGDKDGLSLLGDPKDAQHLQNVKKRQHKKAQSEKNFRLRSQSEIHERDRQEASYLEEQRLRELHLTRMALQKYLTLEARLNESSRASLKDEDEAILILKKAHDDEISAVYAAHDADLEEMLNADETINRNVNPSGIDKSALMDKNRDIMMTAHVFHEMRNVLASILCLGENLLEEPDMLQEIIGEQNDICSYGLDTMSDMLDVAKLRTASYHPKDDVISVPAMLREVIRIQGQRARKGVKVISCARQPDTLEILEVITERRLLRQLLVNLLSNSAKFTVKGSIVVYARALRGPLDFNTLNDDHEGVPDRVLIGVADTGPGVSKAIHDMINDTTIAAGSITSGFIDTTSQSSSSAQSLDVHDYTCRSSGYGLYLSSTIARSLRSTLSVISPLPVDLLGTDTPHCPGLPGSFFYIVLPLQQEVQLKDSKDPTVLSEAEKIPSPKRRISLTSARERGVLSSPETDSSLHDKWQFNPRGRLLLLIVDDQKLLRHSMLMVFKHLCEQFHDLECDIHTANSAEEAVRKHKSIGFDIITLDENYKHCAIEAAKAMSRTDEGHVRSTSPLRMRTSSEKNRTEINSFRRREHFQIKVGDGGLLGSQVAGILSDTESCPIVISCTGCDTVKHPYVLMKPYCIEGFIKLMEQHVHDFLKKASVSMRFDTVVKRDGLVLYDLCKS